ncbi:signal peptidase I [Candidatus Enterococcus mansonii]|uniref:Signal peptidase I n=1 Tax=Candidatus Enterococcus mansonii TaxID=1834181 RepID=A0A242CCA5_9ENTE|nr:signal peptidase I [Enterococcus sp. 4G2_DIV0659]OTO07841.1 hypothetical protein A5880_002111 [Enterococcus sp. 4G2_DIV0659]
MSWREQKKIEKKSVHSRRLYKNNQVNYEKKKQIKKKPSDEWQEHTIHLKASKLKKKSVKRKKKYIRKKRWRKQVQQLMKELGISFILLGTILYIISLFTFSVVKIEGYSMMPTVNNGDRVFVSKLSKVKRFSMILYKDSKSNEYAVRRIIGLPEEQVSYRNDILTINNVEVYERFLAEQLSRAKDSKTTFTEDWKPSGASIPKGKYLVLGDNRPYAIDSRTYGYIDEKEIIGVVEMRIFPIHTISQF